MALHLFSIHIVKKLLHDLSSRYKLSKTTHPISSLRSNQSEDWAFEFLWFDRARALCKNIGIAIILHAARDDSGSPFIEWQCNADEHSPMLAPRPRRMSPFVRTVIFHDVSNVG